MSPELRLPGTNACLVPTKQDSPNEAARRMVTIKMNSFQIDIVRLWPPSTQTFYQSNVRTPCAQKHN